MLKLALIMMAFTAWAEIQDKTMLPDKSIVYKTVGDVNLSLKVFLPKDFKAGEKRPCAVFFHGGAWDGGTPNQFFPHCRHLAERGMVAMSAEYRLRKVHKTSAMECVIDAKSAIRYIRKHAAELGIAPEKIAAGGGSAGGQMAAAAATSKGFDEKDEDLKISSQPNALVLFNPVFDNGPGGYGDGAFGKHSIEISPLHNIVPGIAPAILFFGSKDTFVPVATAEKFRDEMKKAGNRCDLMMYEGKGHGFFNYRPGDKGGNIFYHKTVQEMDKFLESLGYIAPEPKTKD